MSASSITKETKKQSKTDNDKSSGTKNEKKDTASKVLYIKDIGDASKRPTVLDGIKKEVIRYESKSQSMWEEKYGYLKGTTFQKILAEESAKAGIPIERFKRQKVDAELQIKHSFINLEPSPPIPKTSLGIIGWRSAVEKWRLESPGQMYISPKRTINPPPEPNTLPLTQQRFIFLG